MESSLFGEKPFCSRMKTMDLGFFSETVFLNCCQSLTLMCPSVNSNALLVLVEFTYFL